MTEKEKKTKRVKVNNHFALEADKVIVIGLKPNNQIQLYIAGKLEFEEALDMANTTILEFLNTFYESVPKANRTQELKKEIYERANWGAGLMLDKFYPEGKEEKFGKLTDEAVMKAQDDILKKKKNKK